MISPNVYCCLTVEKYYCFTVEKSCKAFPSLFIVCTPPPLSAGGCGGGRGGGGGGGVEPPTKFSKRGGLTGTQFLEGGYWEIGCSFLQGGVQFFDKK